MEERKDEVTEGGGGGGDEGVGEGDAGRSRKALVASSTV